MSDLLVHKLKMEHPLISTMDTVTVYGIANCDVIKKTMDWFRKRGLVVEFHDYKSRGIQKEKIAGWCRQVGWELLLNKKSTTWRSLPAEIQEKITDETTAVALMVEYNSIIKRPVVEMNNKLIVGFNEMNFINQ